ncbi:HP domain-containing protein [Caenorhabditis elegans]|uniref:HP domain-containing protein n=1 Tax=Caenorhabditis elegans TaxID=6239 RepID=P91041_CAEEL|nr:HP domain-containing protein [Caenorhabditis elegans]CCD64214.1 HP domain-containing protein [Caenorhabditis elegans]|eukprot:NP_491442.1 VILliN related [Caenorhabditis elegans]
MIAQLQKSLIQQNSTFEKKNNVEVAPIAKISLKDRLASLNNSAEQWKSRPERQPAVQQRRTSANVLQDLPIFQRAQQLHQQQQRPQSFPVVQEKPCDITSGLKKFFGSNPTTSGASSSLPKISEITASNDIDLDAISSKATPVLKTVTRPRAPNRKKSDKSSTFDERIRLDAVKIDEEAFAVVEEEPEKLETQEQAIAAIQGAKQLLKSPTKVSPYPDVMLIQVRGSKNVDVRLVAPAMSSVHEVACFVVVHQKHLMKYEGLYSNILEKTKASQLCIEILGKSDLNCTAESIVTVTGASRSTLSKLLFCSENSESSSENNNYHQASSVEPFETTVAKLNLVLRIAGDNTAETCSRRERLSYEIMKPSEVLIFDFGSEIYVWTGRYSNKVSSAYAQEYAKQLMKKPVKNGKFILGDAESIDQDGRPEWTLSRKIHQGVLDTLFKAKFSDWPETREVLTTCKPRALISKKNPEVKTYEDVKVVNQDDEVADLVERMLQEQELDPILVLEDQEIDRKIHDVISEDRSLWVLRGEVLQSIEEFTEHFDSRRCYVLRWKYRIQKSGVRRIKTGKEEERETGRSRIAFWYWLGEHTTPKQHGLCALRIKEIDRDNSPRIRIADGNEPALFLALFDGKFMVSSDISEMKPLRRYVVIGANSRETSLREIDDLNSPLRSHAAYIEVEKDILGPSSVVCGANCTEDQVHFVLAHAEYMRQKAGVKGNSAEIEVEGDKKSRSWVNSNGRKRAMRVWRLFDNESEQVNHLSGHKNCAFTFSQQVLKETILIDVGDALWLWSEEVITTFALKVAEKYWKDRSGPAKVVYKGAEPEQFKGLFMKWEMFEVEDDKPSDPPRDVSDLLKERCRTFSLEELKERTSLPAGMDMRRLESYLTDDDFMKVFKIERSEFYAQKTWKQNDARKRVGLF